MNEQQLGNLDQNRIQAALQEKGVQVGQVRRFKIDIDKKRARNMDYSGLNGEEVEIIRVDEHGTVFCKFLDPKWNRLSPNKNQPFVYGTSIEKLFNGTDVESPTANNPNTKPSSEVVESAGGKDTEKDDHFLTEEAISKLFDRLDEKE